MAAKNILHKNVNKNESLGYFSKAAEFYDSMMDCFREERWNSAALEAVHCCISANDALTIWSKGIRCTSHNHDDAVTLLQSLSDLKDVKTGASHFLRVIKKKNLVEYEGKKFGKNEAAEIILHAERFFKWVNSILS
ncbi:MAG: hypothetical protein NT099_06235 [Candidatus Saganbacteria bacterium]|nr:hypothetical protein [Candidatus Saganbacteria bacterium]